MDHPKLLNPGARRAQVLHIGDNPVTLLAHHVSSWSLRGLQVIPSCTLARMYIDTHVHIPVPRYCRSIKQECCECQRASGSRQTFPCRAGWVHTHARLLACMYVMSHFCCLKLCFSKAGSIGGVNSPNSKQLVRRVPNSVKNSRGE